jgi:hypothetical protein
MKKVVFVLLAALCLSLELRAADSADTGEKKKSKGFSGFFDSLLNSGKPTTSSSSQGTNEVALTGISSDQITSGLKAALEIGMQKAVAQLGQSNGFLTNISVKIPLPEKLTYVERGLRKVHEEQLADEFVATMNHAAEQAVPVASGVLLDSLRQMSLSDATTILASKNPTAATDYFRQTTSTALFDKFLPIVQDATGKVGVTSSYKKMMEKASFGTSIFAKSSLDVDQYVTNKTLDGLFKMVGEEEKRIRENPQARATELLQKVFGAIQR